MRKKIFNVFVAIFTISGFSGLIYESIWTHYLKLFLGHSAYAQSLVLAIFMGGMALGSWICSRYSVRWKNLLAAYAAAEALIGLSAVFFHDLFDLAVHFSYTGILPRLSSPLLANGFKWALSSLMILPQSVLLGMTFPLMTAGVIRRRPEQPGSTISLLYFSNSLGGAVGVLASGFFLIRAFGLPGTIRTAGLINIALAAVVWHLAKGRDSTAPEPQSGQDPARDRGSRPAFALFLLVSFLTGAASFMYEIGWIRMLNLVLGSSTHAFELMLSAFILGLSLGGLWIERRIDRLKAPERFLASVQVVMGLLALATLPLYGGTFGIMRWLVNTVSRTDMGYVLFNLSSNGLALAVMLPATFCAGMTLPLITVLLLKRGHGERSIGGVYAANTVGAILGVFFAVHIGMPHLGLKGLLVAGAGVDIGLGALLFRKAVPCESKRLPSLVAAGGVAALVLVLLLVNPDRYNMVSGVYRTGKLLMPQATELIYYKDGKTASICTFREKYSGVVSIATNGKPDASLRLSLNSPPTMDEPTMILLAALPMAFNPEAKTAVNIGLGSGLTTHTLLYNPSLEAVDTVEIEESVIEAAKNFGQRVELAYLDPRSHIVVEDAKTYFSVQNKKYDIIISEPSNPSVSGVAGLFSDEFYRLLRQQLNKDGVFAQWVQLYDIDNELVLSILKAISRNFSDYVAFAANDGDMLIVARKEGALRLPDARVFRIPGLAQELERIKISSIQDVEIRRIGNKGFLNKLVQAADVRANSDYYPVVDQNIGRTSFERVDATAFRSFSRDLLPALEALAGFRPSWKVTDVVLSPLLSETESANTAMALRDYILDGKFGIRYGAVPPGVRQEAAQLKQIFYDCRNGSDAIGRRVVLFNSAVAMIPYLTQPELDAVWKKLKSGPCGGSVSPGERNWIALFEAVSRRDPAAMVNASTTILRSEERMPPNALKFFVASGMLGCLMQGDREGAHRLWSAYRAALEPQTGPDLLFRLLKAESRISQ